MLRRPLLVGLVLAAAAVSGCAHHCCKRAPRVTERPCCPPPIGCPPGPGGVAVPALPVPADPVPAVPAVPPVTSGFAPISNGCCH
jgi:hypothetical protein